MTKAFLTGNQAFGMAALEAGVRVAAGYPGTPSSEVIETIAAKHAQGVAQGVHVEWSTNEKAALELLSGAAYAGARTLFTCKQVGLNVASDPLMSLNYVGVKGGTVLFVADDPGPISSQTEQDTRRFAAFAKVPVFDPATPDQGYAMMGAAFDLSERYHTPVILRPTTRIAHASTFFDVPEHTQARPVEGFEKDDKWVIFPKRARLGHKEINERLALIAKDFAHDPALAAFNPTSTGGEGTPTLGIVAGGISAGYAQEALQLLAERAQAAGKKLPGHKFIQVGTPYPFPEDLVAKWAQGLDQVIVFEELDHVLEDEMTKLAGKRHLPFDVHGKLDGTTRDRCENDTSDCLCRLAAFLGLPELADAPTPTDDIEPLLAVRPPILCAGCPHRGAFYAVKRAVGKRKDARLCGDIGCYTLGNAQPLDAVDTCLCMGAGITQAQGFAVVEPGTKAVAFVGDSTFFASGMTGVANAVYNQHDVTICVLDNATTAMTGSQPHPGTGNTLMGPKSKPISIEAVVRALGVECVKRVNPLFLEDSVSAVKEAIDHAGPSVVIFQSPCTSLVKPDAPVTLDVQACNGCKVCVSSIGCPALSWNWEANRPKIDPSLCVGCGLCTDLCKHGALDCPGRRDHANEPRFAKPVPYENGIYGIEPELRKSAPASAPKEGE